MHLQCESEKYRHQLQKEGQILQKDVGHRGAGAGVQQGQNLVRLREENRQEKVQNVR